MNTMIIQTEETDNFKNYLVFGVSIILLFKIIYVQHLYKKINSLTNNLNELEKNYQVFQNYLNQPEFKEYKFQIENKDLNQKLNKFVCQDDDDFENFDGYINFRELCHHIPRELKEEYLIDIEIIKKKYLSSGLKKDLLDSLCNSYGNMNGYYKDITSILYAGHNIKHWSFQPIERYNYDLKYRFYLLVKKAP